MLDVHEDVVMEIEDVAVEELEHDKGKFVLLKLKDGKVIHGKLEDVDKRINITLSGAEQTSTDGKTQPLDAILVRGDSVIIVPPS